jgi:hypothetical protein
MHGATIKIVHFNILCLIKGAIVGDKNYNAIKMHGTTIKTIFVHVVDKQVIIHFVLKQCCPCASNESKFVSASAAPLFHNLRTRWDE